MSGGDGHSFLPLHLRACLLSLVSSCWSPLVAFISITSLFGYRYAIQSGDRSDGDFCSSLSTCFFISFMRVLYQYICLPVDLFLIRFRVTMFAVHVIRACDLPKFQQECLNVSFPAEPSEGSRCFTNSTTDMFHSFLDLRGNQDYQYDIIVTCNLAEQGGRALEMDIY